jgi:hypothetical protein
MARKITKEEFDAYAMAGKWSLATNQCCEPPLLEARLDGKPVAFAKLWDGSDYHFGKSAEYFMVGD